MLLSVGRHLGGAAQPLQDDLLDGPKRRLQLVGRITALVKLSNAAHLTWTPSVISWWANFASRQPR
jgi:hypothetical protein